MKSKFDQRCGIPKRTQVHRNKLKRACKEEEEKEGEPAARRNLTRGSLRAAAVGGEESRTRDDWVGGLTILL